ncbi:uncharacterized protein LOC109710309, partial [Ananas comosus]|uniref:Uncharacterized protein LOC109710309 n=1 Tax=Ananas comosus TaxID=4615 RepID=A0A6P5F4L2_ANACO
FGPLDHLRRAARSAAAAAEEVAAWAAKGGVSAEHDDEKALVGFLNESKDQPSAENSIPLSPQWLYAKPADSKFGVVAASGDARPPTPKDMWRLDSSLDKKEWRRNVPDIDSNRRWLEEERETSLLGRRERRKEGDRETAEYRKNNRRSDNISMREVADSKWSSRWGPEDKEKDSRLEKKMDVDKDDSHVQKQQLPFSGGLRPLSESDSRDKWRPRYRQEIQSGGSTMAHHGAPGFGLEKGRAEGSNVGFAPGRGRSNLSRSFSTGPIGALPVERNVSETVHTFRYPRGKLLDIYRKQRTLPSFEATPEGLEEVPSITLSSSVTPLAFLTLDDDEKAAVNDIWEGKVTSSEADSPSKEHATGVDNEIGSDYILGEFSDNVKSLTIAVDNDRISPLISENDAFYDTKVSLGTNGSVEKPGERKLLNNDGHARNSDFLKNSKLEEVDPAATFDVSAKLPYDSSSLFVTPTVQVIQKTIELSNSSDVAPNPSTPPEELSLFYRDPQGRIQGPFLVADIMSWLEEGYFGTDLPVCPSDAPEGTPFRPLGELIPHLTSKSEQVPVVSPVQNIEPLESARGNSESRIHEFAVQDADEVLYRGKLMSMDRPLVNLTSDQSNLLQTSSGHILMASEVGQVSLPNQRDPKDNDLNSRRLLFSELEGTQPKNPLLSVDQPFPETAAVKDVSLFSHRQEQHMVPDEFSTKYRKNSSSNVLHDAIGASHLPTIEHQFNLEEHLLSQQLLKQRLQQEELLAQQNLDFLHHQQSNNHQVPDLEHMLKLQFELDQQQRLQQLQQQNIRQQLHQQEMQFLQQQQEQQQQLLLEQMLHQQLNGDPRHRNNNILDEVLLRQHLLNESQQQSHYLQREHDALVEQLIQAKFMQNRQHGQNLLDILSHSNSRQMLPFEQQKLLLDLQQEQMLRAQQFPIPSRQQSHMEERFNQFIQPSPSAHLNHSSRLSPLDFVHPPQRASSVELNNQIERNVALHELLNRGQGIHPLDRAISLPTTSLSPNIDLVNDLSHIHSSVHPYQHRMPEQYGGSLMDAMEGHLMVDSNRQLSNNLIESQLRQFQIEAERQRRGVKLSSSFENREHDLGNMMNQKMVLQSHQSLGLSDVSPSSSYGRGEPSWLYSHPIADNSCKLAADRTDYSESLVENSLFATTRQASQDGLVNANFGSQGMPFQSTSGMFLEQKLFPTDADGIHKEELVNTMGRNPSIERLNFADPNDGRSRTKPGSKANFMGKSILDNLEAGVGQMVGRGQEEMEVAAPNRPATFGSAGGDAIFQNYEVGDDNAFVGEISKNRNSSATLKGTDSSTLKLAHDQRASVSSEAAFSELVSTLPVKDAKREPGGVSDVPSSAKKDATFRRVPSGGIIAGASEPSFIDMLKSTSKKPTLEADASASAPSDSSESMQGSGSKSNIKKKGKKGRQIDPSLLGFKVHSNRIMMGEIQRPED